MMTNKHYFLVAGLLLSSIANVNALEITPLLGYRGGGEFIDTVENRKHTASSSDTFGVIIGGDTYNQGKRLELYFSRQATDIRSISIPVSGPAPQQSVTVPLTISYLHFGGTAPISDEDRFKTFVSGGLGFTYMSPDFSGLQSDLRASLSVGAGMRMPLTEHIDFRLEARLLATLFNNNSSIFCSGGCTIQINGSAFYQGEVFAGVTFRFQE